MAMLGERATNEADSPKKIFRPSREVRRRCGRVGDVNHVPSRPFAYLPLPAPLWSHATDPRGRESDNANLDADATVDSLLTMIKHTDVIRGSAIPLIVAERTVQLLPPRRSPEVKLRPRR